MNTGLKYLKIILLASFIFFAYLGSVYAALKEPLPFKLLGTVVESDSTKSLAVIQNIDTLKQGTYKVIDKVLDYQLTKIMRGRVVLLKEGKLYLLEFPLGSVLEPIVMVSAKERIINRAALAKKLSDLNVAMQQAVPIPYIEAGKIIGFKLTNVKDKNLAKLAGIKEGDVIMSVNGNKLNSIRNTLDIYSRIKGQEKINLEIKSGNELKNLTYYMN